MLSPSSEPGVHSCQVTLLPPSALVVHNVNVLSVDNIRDLIENTGYGAEIVTSKVYSATTATNSQADATTYKVNLSILGMTCSSCVSSVNGAIESIPGTTLVSIDLIGDTGSVVVQRKEDADLVRSEIEAVGFECSIVMVSEYGKTEGEKRSTSRMVTIKVTGLFCG